MHEWTWFDLYEGVGVLEFDERDSPVGFAVELVVDYDAGPTMALWVCSQTGRPLWIVLGGQA